jgi:hypothetical protein
MRQPGGPVTPVMSAAAISTARQPPHKIGAKLPAVVVFDEAQQAPVPDAPNDHGQMYGYTVHLSRVRLARKCRNHAFLGRVLGEPRNRRPADIVALRQFLQRSALRAPSDGLFLLGRCEGRGAAHVLPLGLARLLPSAVRVRIRSRSTSARPPRTASIKRPVLVPVSAHGSARIGIAPWRPRCA